MGKLNTAIRAFLSDRERFADLFNGVFFQGKTVIRAERLQEASEVYSDMAQGLLDRTRDLKMTDGSGGTLSILALEVQATVDYTLPYRCMQYDALEYGRQIRELKKHNRDRNLFSTPGERLCGILRQDRLTPVYTLCLYHGEEHWDGALSLGGMTELGADREYMGRYFADYPITLFCVNEQDSFHMFHTELREVFAVMSYRGNKRKLYETLLLEPAYRGLDEETLKVMSVLLDAPGLWKDRKKYITTHENREGYDMCQAMKELLADATAAGREQGISRGIHQGAEDKTRTVVLNMLARGMAEEDICAIAECTAGFVRAVRAKGR